MTKLMIMSDTHLEFCPEYTIEDSLPKWAMPEFDIPDYDILVLAGDDCTLRMTENAFSPFINSLPKKPIVAVYGNHSFYHGNIKDKLDKQWLDNPELFHMLDNSTCEIDGVKFAGSVLWSNCAESSIKNINDYYIIQDFNIWDEHNKALEFFAEDWEADVIITHFPPSYKSIADQYIGNSLNDYFCNDREDLISEHNEKLWVSGHTHSDFDYYVKGVRVYSNQKGYPHENSSFELKVVEI